MFDILWIDGYDIIQLPLVERKLILENLLKTHEIVKDSTHFEDGINLDNTVLKLGIEGIVAK